MKLNILSVKIKVLNSSIIKIFGYSIIPTKKKQTLIFKETAKKKKLSINKTKIKKAFKKKRKFK